MRQISLKINILILFFIISTGLAFGQIPALVPQPEKIRMLSGNFQLSTDTRIYLNNPTVATERIASLFNVAIKELLGKELMLMSMNPKNQYYIQFNLIKNDSLGAEGYRLKVEPKRILLYANKEAGLFYGIQTLLALLPEDLSPINKSFNINCVEVYDRPRFSYRGAHLDVSRHFMPKAFVKKYIDYLAMHKMNYFHWHLTDDQGWRIEIKKYPRLTEVGSQRTETLIGHFREHTWKFDGKPHGGYYTQQDIKEIVKYAEARFVTIVPEIELPGHAQALLKAYPEYGCTNTEVEARNYWGISTYILNPEEKTFQMLEDVLSEVCDLFPGKYIHIGGDEAEKEQWYASKAVQQRIKDLKLAGPTELQSYFIQRIGKFLNSKNRRMIGWDEIMDGGMDTSAVIMAWRGVNKGMEAAKKGHQVVLTPGEFCYFDSYQADKTKEPLAIGGMLTLEKVYSFEPILAGLSSVESKRILGAQANLWTEYIPTPEHAEYMLLPRLCALSEVLWTPSGMKNYLDFKVRMQSHRKRLDKMNANYSKAGLD